MYSFSNALSTLSILPTKQPIARATKMDEQHSAGGTPHCFNEIFISFIFIDKKYDSKYRRYVAALEKCLQSFESVNEWADVISFLSRLGKV